MPAVATTVPAANALGVAADASIAVTFNRPVNVAADWFDISCAVSGTHAASVTRSCAASATRTAPSSTPHVIHNESPRAASSIAALPPSDEPITVTGLPPRCTMSWRSCSA